MDNFEERLARLRADVLLGYEQAKRGEARPLDTKKISIEGRKRLAALQNHNDDHNDDGDIVAPFVPRKGN